MENLIEIFKANNGFLKSKDISTRTQWRVLNRMLNENSVTKIRRGLYRINDNEVAYQYAEVANIIPDGVLCMYSALFYYNLTVQIPQALCVAIEKNHKVALPVYPPIQLYYWKKEYHELGVITKNIDGYNIKIYDLEKSVCDAVKFRNKIGIDIAAEVLKNYLQRQDRNLVKLGNYAKQMRIEKILRTYLEVEL